MPRKPRRAPSTPRSGWLDALRDAFVATTRSVEDMQRAISRRPFDALEAVPPLAPVAGAVRAAHDRIAGVVYAGLRGAAHVAHAGATQLALARGSEDNANATTGRLRSALNAAFGDALAADGNPLALEMVVHGEGAQPRVVVFVHGLGCDERSWRREGGVDYGERMRALGWTPLYVRYNTGLAHASNGARLAQLLQRTLAAWPVPVSDLVLVGHSLGGLVVLHACEAAARKRLRWLRATRMVVTLGTPHRGAPLERLGRFATRVLGAHDVSAPLARLGDVRSAGVRELGDGLQHTPLPDGIAFRALGSTLASDPGSAPARWIGDGLVPLDSALAMPAARDSAHAVLGGLGHLGLLADARVWAQLAAWLDLSADRPQSRASLPRVE